MATIRYRNGKYHAQIRRKGFPQQTRSFLAKRDATAWARQAETQLDQGNGIATARSNITLGDLIKRYRDTVSPKKKSGAKETYRLNKLLTYSIAQTKLPDLSPALFAQFRDRRLKDGQRTCRYDLVLLQHILKLARLEWGIPLTTNPVEQIKKPPPSKPRDRRLETGEFEKLRDAALAGSAWYLWPLVELAIETGMRRGELLKVLWVDLDIAARQLTIRDTKNGEDRTIPLTTRAATILQTLPLTDDCIFPISPVAVRMAWDRMIKRAGIVGLRFHDLRHEAVSRFFELGLSVPEVALISGHKNPVVLLRYTHLRAQDLVAKLG
jgi:integrase